MRNRVGFTFPATKHILPSSVQYEMKVYERATGKPGDWINSSNGLYTANHTLQTKLIEFKFLVQLSMAFLEL